MKNHFSRAGMTMIELVSALAIFLFILGALTMALNKATTLWSSSHTKQYEQEKATLILSVIASDLEYAVTDNGAPNAPSSEIPATFFCDSSTNQPSTGETRIILKFIKYRTKSSPFNTTPDDAPALDAVFYIFADDALFRHVIPLKYSDPDDLEHIGQLLEQTQINHEDSLKSTYFHDQLLNYLKDPLDIGSEPAVNWEYSLLADKITQPVILTAYPTRYVKQNESHLDSIPPSPQSLQLMPVYDKVESTVLPNYMDISIRVFNESEWAKYIFLFNSALDADTFSRKERYLGSYSSRRITFKTMRGARLQ